MLLIYSLQHMSLLAMLAEVRYTDYLEGLSDIEGQAACFSDGFTKDLCPIS